MWCVVLPSIAHLNVNELSAIVTVFEVVRLWALDVITRLPVLAVYAAPITGFGKLPELETIPFVTADTNVCA